MGTLPFLKASLKNRPTSCRRFPEESLTVPVVLHFHSHWSVLQHLTLPGLWSLVIIADVLPLLLLTRRMLCRRLVCWRMLCRRLAHWRMLCCLWFVGGCFATVSSVSSLADALLPRVTWPFHHYGCLAVVDIFASLPADAWSLVGSLVDALRLFGSLADVLPSSLLGGLLCSRPL
jgi:hypothetical protein